MKINNKVSFDDVADAILWITDNVKTGRKVTINGYVYSGKIKALEAISEYIIEVNHKKFYFASYDDAINFIEDLDGQPIIINGKVYNNKYAIKCLRENAVPETLCACDGEISIFRDAKNYNTYANMMKYSEECDDDISEKTEEENFRDWFRDLYSVG